MGIIENLFIKLNRNITVVHTLPGRLRIHLPIVKNIPAEYEEFLPVINSILSTPEEITSIEVSPLSGNILIKYDKGKSTEDQIITFVDSVMEILFRFKEKVADILNSGSFKVEMAEKAREKLIETFAKSVTTGPYIDRTLEIERDVLE